MTTPIDHPAAVAAAARAVEEKWDEWQNAIPPKMPPCRKQDGIHFPHYHLLMDCESKKEAFVAASERLLAARRAAREAGYVEVMVSREAVTNLDNALDLLQQITPANVAHYRCSIAANIKESRDLLARDLNVEPRPKE